MIDTEYTDTEYIDYAASLATPPEHLVCSEKPVEMPIDLRPDDS